MGVSAGISLLSLRGAGYASMFSPTSCWLAGIGGSTVGGAWNFPVKVALTTADSYVCLIAFATISLTHENFIVEFARCVIQD